MKSTLIVVGILASFGVTHGQMCFPDEVKFKLNIFFKL